MKEHGGKKSSKAQTNEDSGTGGISGHLGNVDTSIKGELGMKEAVLSEYLKLEGTQKVHQVH